MSEASASSGMKIPVAFLLRRLHSLSGLVPVGAFMCVHLFANFGMLVGWLGKQFPILDDYGFHAESFQKDVDFIHSMPGLIFIEIALWSSIAFHAILGFYYIFAGTKNNVKQYGFESNWRYTAQRVTGMIAFFFIVFHVATLRWKIGIDPHYLVPFYGRVSGEPMSDTSVWYALTSHPWAFVIYFIGTASCVFHFANGMWTMAITWGVTITKKAQKRWGYVCIGIGAILSVFFIGALIGAAMIEPTPEQKELYEKKRSGEIKSHAAAPHHDHEAHEAHGDHSH